MHVAFDPMRIAQELISDGVLAEKLLQTMAKRSAFRPLHQSLIKHDSATDVPPFQWNAPRPPSIAHEVIRGRPANSVAGLRPAWKFLRQFPAVPIFDSTPARPNRAPS